MAVKWAVASGNWNATATWNDGVIPVDGDVIYLNYKTLTINVDVFQPNSVITNDANSDYNIISGGEVRINRPSVTINFRNTESPTRYLVSSAGSQNNIHIIGNVDCMSFYANSSASRTLAVTGNVNIAEGGVFFSQTQVLLRITITGNLTLGGILQTTLNTTTEVACAVPIYIAGKFAITRAINQFATEVHLTGMLFYNKRLCITNLHINGNIEYENTTTSILLRTNNLDIQNPDTFTWKDITEPRSNPFIIVTDAEMNNRQQYPPENEVKQGTEYVWGEKVGTYQQPPESVVLKDYVYDNDEKTGTLVTTNISQQLISRLENCATIETVQQLLVAHLDD